MIRPSLTARRLRSFVVLVAVSSLPVTAIDAQTAGGGARPPAQTSAPPTAASTPPTVTYSHDLQGLVTSGARAYTLPPGQWMIDMSSGVPMYRPLPPLPTYGPSLSGHFAAPWAPLPHAQAWSPGQYTVTSPEVAKFYGSASGGGHQLSDGVAYALSDGVHAIDAHALTTAGVSLFDGAYVIDLSRDAVGRSLDAIRNTSPSRFDARSLQAEIERATATMHRAFRSSIGSVPRNSWDSQDVADSVYRRARQALTSESYRQAAELFRRIRNSYPQSTYTPDAPYWEAFALSRLGGVSDLRKAQEALEWQSAKHPRAATSSDAKSLSARVGSQLARNGDATASEHLVSSLFRAAGDETRRSSPSSDGCAVDDERIDALNAVTTMNPEAALPTLRKVLARRENCTQHLRRTAVWIIGMRKISGGADLLMQSAKTDPDRDVREQAVFWLANFPSDAAVSMLSELVKSDVEVDIRRRAVYSLSRSNSPRADATLRELALDNNAHIDLRSDAVQWIMASSKADAGPFLREVYTKTDNATLRERLLPSIVKQGESARDFLIGVTGDNRESLTTRVFAVSYLASVGVSAAQFGTIYERASAPEVKQAVLTQLAKMKDNAGVEKLVEITRNEKDAQLRKTAVAHLTRINDPRALAVLQEIIDR